MGRGLPYQFFNAIAQYQYSVADVIGVQTPGNRSYFDDWLKKSGGKLEVLQNWLGKPAADKCVIRLDETSLAGRKVFVYAGNMGVAQGMDIVLHLAEKMLVRSDVGFVLVGRGSEVQRLKTYAQERSLSNVLFLTKSIPIRFRICMPNAV